MRLHINVNRATFERILSGEQDEIYVRDDHHWQRKLTHPKTLRPRRIDRFYISNGTKENRRLISAKYDYFTLRRGRAEWGAPQENVLVIKLSNPALLLPPYPVSLALMSVRNRKK